MKLRPNCLLTRYPLCFIQEPTSFWNFLNPWKKTHRYLKAHGYEVYVLNHNKKPFQRLEQIKSKHGKVHIITAQQTSLESLTNQIGIASLNYLEGTKTSSPSISTQRIVKSKTKSLHEIILDHSIFLAENDLATGR
ncbi:MAG: hypothetical protein SGI74_01550 [Oligoflexia bacterium]|nr:hypothetical protein [Oligoflexia bacterium]